MKNPNGLLIVLEGIDGAGKSSHMMTVANYFKERSPKWPVVLTREPLSGPFGFEIVDLINRYPELNKTAQAFLINAARHMHVHDIIAPALKRGCVVVCDRFTASTLAYQGKNRGIKTLNHEATRGVDIDLCFWLDVHPKIAHQRIRERDLEDGLTIQSIEELYKLRNHYRRIFNATHAVHFPNVRINADYSFEVVQQNIIQKLDELLKAKGHHE